MRTPIAYQVHDAAAQAVEALRAPAQTAASATSGFWSNFWSGLQGSQRLPSNATPPGRVGQPTQGDSTSSGPNPHSQAENPGLGQIGASGYDFQSAVAASAQIPQASPAQASATPTGVPIVSPGGTQGPTTSGNAVLDAVLLGVQQLQTLQAQQLTNPKKADAPETVKTGITAFPKLAPPDPAGGSLEFQDWMQLIAGLMSDFSDSSQLWWSGVVQVSKDAYDKWVVASPIERLTVEPDERPELTEGKWGRVNARACAMLLDALDPTVKSDIIARKANQAASQILFRLYTTYQPGGTGERNLVLSNLQNPHVVQDAVAGVSALRAWGRWYQRCIDFGMSLPDPMVLVGGLTSMTKPVISKEPEVSWRTEMVKSALQLHGRPSEEAVKSYHKHLLAEFETLAGAQVAKKGGSSNLALKAADASGDKGGKASGAKGGGKGGGNGAPCKYFLSPKGCKFGSKCKYPHSMNELSKAERFKKCLNCGSEEHRAKDCKAGKAEPKTQEQKPSVQAASTSTPTVHATPVLSMETFMQQAVQALRQLEANPSRNDATPSSQQPHPQPEGVSTASQPASTPNPSVKRLTIRSVMPSSCFPVPSSSPADEPPVEPSPVASQPPLIGYALLDSGATHPMRQASSEEEWIEADEVQVSLAGDQTTVMRLTRAGTLLLPPGRDGLVQPIVPMGAIIEQLGYKLVWSAGSCKLYPPDGKSLRLRVKNGCPELVESQALTLISRLEEHKLQKVEELRRRTEEGKDRIRQAKIAMERTWWDHLVEHVSSSAPAAGHMAVSTAPFFHDVPDRALSGILPSDDVDSKALWKALEEGMPYLNRRRRKALHRASNWVVHLFAGPGSHKAFKRLESQDTVVVELDICRSRSQDLYHDPLWRLLVKVAKLGRVAAVIGGPPSRTWSVKAHRADGPHPLRSSTEPFGLSTLTSDERDLVDRHTGLCARMMWLHALSTAGRRVHHNPSDGTSMVAFMLEQPQSVEQHVVPDDCAVSSAPSFWNTTLWQAYADEAGLFEVSFRQGPLGHAGEKPTTVGTNLPDLRDLQGLQGEASQGCCSADSRVSPVWAPGFVQAIVYALQRWPCYRLMKFTQADWEQHVANNHVPYRRDCAVCVHGAGNGRRHKGVVHPDVYCMSADIAGPIRVKGKDPESRNHRPATFKYFLAVSYRFPRLKGVKEESDPTKTDGFDDAALLPGGTDDLADEALPLAEGAPSEHYEESLYEPSLTSEEAGEEGVEGPREFAAKVVEEHPWESDRCELQRPPDMARLVFAVPLHTNKGDDILNALQQVYISLRSLNLPVLRFHTDRSREFFNKKTRAWFHERGVRTTTTEGDVPQQNGSAENTVRWLKARARTLLTSGEVDSSLWPCAIMTAAAQQRAQQLGMKSKLAIHFGGKCSVKRKFFSKKGDLEDRWVEGKYMGLSPSVNDGHIVLRSDGVGNGFVQTLHVRTRLVSPDPPPLQFVGDSLEEEHSAPPRRVRGKRSSGERPDHVVAPLPPPAEAPHPEGFVPLFEEESARVARLSLQDLEVFAKELIEEDWDLDGALWVLAEVCRAAPELQHKAGLYRHGGRVGVLGSTADKPWLTELMIRVLSSVAPTAEYTSLWLSNSTAQPVHTDHHNLQGSTNVVLPLKLPPNGGDLWIELKSGDLVSGSVEERVDGKGRRWLGTTHKLERGKPFFLDPTRRHATTPWKGERAVLVAYTVNTLGKELEHECQGLEALGFPLPASVRLPLTEQQDVRRLDAFDCFEEEPLQEVEVRHPDGQTSGLAGGSVLKGGGWKETQAVEAGTVELEVSWNLKHTPDQQRAQSQHALRACQPDTEAQVEEEEGVSEDSFREQPVLWELWVPDPQAGEQLCVLRSDDSDASEARALYKSEPVYTPNVELLLDGLQEPLQVVHTVDPRDAEQCIEKWMPAIHKEIGVIEKAVRRLPPAEVRSGGWLRRKDVKVVPSKFVFTVKPPDPAEGEASLASRKGQAYHKRKARLVACGNHAPGTGSEVYASGAAAETLRCFVVISSKRRWCIGSLDVTSAFLLTPIPQGKGFPVFALTPPRLLVRLGLAEEGELWILTHAVYGLRESPKLWSDFRDCQLRALRCVVDGVELQLQQGRLDPNWWRVVRTSDGVVVGGLLTYVDDFLLAGSKEVIAALATAIQGIWKTTPLALATAEHPLRFLGVEILVQGSGFVLSQQAYAEELLRVNDVKPTALGKVPCPRDLVSFDTLLTDESPTEESVRTAQRLTGEILWLSQRTRPDLAFTACVLASLSTKAPQRAIRIAEKALAYVQRTKALALTADADDTGLIAYSDASYAPEGNRSHTGWVVFFHGSPVCWRSARQAFVTLSTAEAELVAGLDAVVALQSAEAMLSEFGVSSFDKTLRVDSQSALAIAIGQGSWRTRHLRVRANYLREQYESGEIIPVYCPGVEQAADLLTKALPSARILELAAIWGLLEHGTSRPAEAEAYSEARTVGSGAVAQQDLHLSTLAVVLALFQVVGASSQSTDEDEDLSLPVSLDADLMLAVSIICIGVCFIAVWEFLKWCFQSVLVRREAGTTASSLSPRKARKLQRLRDQTAQAIQAEISAREEAASSQSATAASKRRPSQTTRAEREQAGGAPTRFFATPEGTKLHRTKTCPTLANSHRFVEYQVCQQCHRSAADHTQHSTG